MNDVDKARRLIAQGRYDEAQAILENQPHNYLANQLLDRLYLHRRKIKAKRLRRQATLYPPVPPVIIISLSLLMSAIFWISRGTVPDDSAHNTMVVTYVVIILLLVSVFLYLLWRFYWQVLSVVAFASLLALMAWWVFDIDIWSELALTLVNIGVIR